VQQRLEEAADEEEFDIDEEFEARAKQEASDHFDKHYKAALMALPYPPEAVAALSDGGSLCCGNVHLLIDFRTTSAAQPTNRSPTIANWLS